MPSLWSYSVQNQMPRYPSLSGNKTCDVLVIGGGLAGVLTARKLAAAGLQTILCEARQLGYGATGNTTAKVTAQHGAVYAHLIAHFGPEKARLYYEANTSALADVQALASQIPCHFEEKTAYLYAREGLETLEKERAAYEQLGIPYVFEEDHPLPGGPAPVLGMPGQAQFDPLEFLYGAAEGLTIYENTFVQSIEGRRAVTAGGTITAHSIVLATHYPLVNIPGLYFMKLNQQRSYVLALENGPQVNGMYIGVDGGKWSMRNFGGSLLLGGGNHTTGEKGGGYRALRRYAASILPAATEHAHWATQDCMTLDRLPYIGRHRENAPGLYVATGFNKWGMTSSMAAANLLCDLVFSRQNPYEALFCPTRSLPPKPLAHRAGESVKGYLHLTKRCTHMGCALHHNKEENSWDCPCHGSRFSDATGEVLDGPAKRPLHS